MDLASALPLTSGYLSSFLFCERRLGAVKFLSSSESVDFKCASLPVFFILFALLFACVSTLCVSLYFYSFKPEITFLQLSLVIERALNCGSQDTWTLVLPLPGCIALGKSVNFTSVCSSAQWG